MWRRSLGEMDINSFITEYLFPNLHQKISEKCVFSFAVLLLIDQNELLENHEEIWEEHWQVLIAEMSV